jgi:DNA-directed RNA polymerase subunit M
MAPRNAEIWNNQRKALKKSLNKKKEEEGLPKTSKKYAEIYVRMIVIGYGEILNTDDEDLWVKVSGYSNIEVKTYSPTKVKCPLCNRNIEWSGKWEAYRCTNEKHKKILLQPYKEDIRREGMKTTIYDENVIGRGHFQKKGKARKNEYTCMLPRNGGEERWVEIDGERVKRVVYEPCGRVTHDIRGLQKHIKHKHTGDIFKETYVVSVSMHGLYAVNTKDYVITRTGETIVTEINCPVCKETAYANKSVEGYVCKNGHISKAYDLFTEEIERDMFWCPHCGREVIIKNDRFLCKGRFRCPHYKEMIKALPKKKKERPKPTGITKELIDKYKPGKIVIKRRTAKDESKVRDDLEDIRSKTERRCPKCGHNEAYWILRQMRGSDEPESRFYECTKCGHKWRED